MPDFDPDSTITNRDVIGKPRVAAGWPGRPPLGLRPSRPGHPAEPGHTLSLPPYPRGHPAVGDSLTGFVFSGTCERRPSKHENATHSNTKTRNGLRMNVTH